jgi:hypothetical protein
MAWSMPTWKILQIYQIQFLFGEVRDETRHSLYTKNVVHSNENCAKFRNRS